MSNQEGFTGFDEATHGQWQKLGTLEIPRLTEKLEAPLIDLLRFGETYEVRTEGAKFISAAIYSGVVTMEHLVLVGAEPISEAMGPTCKGGAGLAVFKEMLLRFWPTMALPEMPSPWIAAMLFDHPRKIRTFPWIIDYIDDVSIGSGTTGGRAPMREMYWSLELLLGADEKIVRSVFELRPGRASAILDYYNEYEALFHKARAQLI